MFMFIVLSIPLLMTMKQQKMNKPVDFMVDCVPPAVEVSDESN